LKPTKKYFPEKINMSKRFLGYFGFFTDILDVTTSESE
jgi:hypothetical protein